MKLKRIPAFLALPFLILVALSQAHASDDAKQIYGIPISDVSEAEYTKLLAGFAANASGKPTAARTIFKQLLDENPKLAIAHIGLSQNANSAEEFNRIVSQADELTEVTQAEKMIVDLLNTFIKNDLEKRVMLTQKLVAAHPQSSWAWRWRGGSLQNAKQIAQARAAFEKAIAIDNSDAMAHLMAANSYMFFAPKDFAKAQSLMQQAVKADPNNSSLYIGLGDAFRAQNDMQAANTNYEVAALLSPDSAVAHIKQGHANTFLGNFEKARTNYKSANDVSDPNDRVNNGNYNFYTYLYEGKPQQAYEQMKSWIATIEQSDADAASKLQAKLNTYNDMAAVALHNDMIDEAAYSIKQYEALKEKQLEKVTDQNFASTQNAFVHFMKGMLAMKKGNFDQAEKHAMEMKSLMEPMKNPRKHELYHEFMGHIAMKQGDADKALKHLEQADVDDIYVKYHMAVLHEKKGETELAQALFDEVKDYNFNEVLYGLVRYDVHHR